MAVNDVYRVGVTNFTQTAEEQVNVYHWQMIVAADDSDAAVLQDFDARIGSLYSAVQEDISNVITFGNAEVDNITQGTKVGNTSDWATALGNGGQIGDVLPLQVTALVIGTTNVLRVQGRKYLPTYGENGSVGGTWDPDVVINMAAFGELWISTFVSGNGNTWASGVQARSNGALGDFTRFNGFKTQPIPRTQKSRYLTEGS